MLYIALPLIYSILIPLHLTHADPDSCKPIRLDEKGGSMEHVTPKIQGPINLCAAHAAADWVDAYRFSHGLHDPSKNYSDTTSHIETAIGHKFRTDHRSPLTRVKETILELFYSSSDRPYEYNLVNGLVDYLKKNGRCDAGFFLGPQEGWAQLEIQLTTLARFIDEYRRTKRESISENPLTRYASRRYAEQRRNEILQELNCKLPELFPKINLPNIEEALMESDQTLNLMYKIYAKGCPSREPVQLPGAGVKVVQDSHTIEEALKQQFDLSDKPQPVPIDYCARLLASGNDYSGILFKVNESLGKIPKISCAPHASLIIGRRYNPEKNRCEVLLRNTWGPVIYHPDFDSIQTENHRMILKDEKGETMKDESGKEIEFTDPKEIENFNYSEWFSKGMQFTEKTKIISGTGDVWIPIDTLARNAFHVYFWE